MESGFPSVAEVVVFGIYIFMYTHKHTDFWVCLKIKRLQTSST